jgi:polar amino acid transport system substrate-binding protein
VKKKENYKEKSNQLSQVKLLYLGRVDLILSDINIFKYYKKILNIDTSKNVRYHCIFPKTEYKVLFRDDKLRDLFNIRLKDLQKSGVYNQILDRYIDDTKSH